MVCTNFLLLEKVLVLNQFGHDTLSYSTPFRICTSLLPVPVLSSLMATRSSVPSLSQSAMAVNPTCHQQLGVAMAIL